MSDKRAAFEKWLDETMGLQCEWQEERNCYKEFAAHLAWKAWDASMRLAAPTAHYVDTSRQNVLNAAPQENDSSAGSNSAAPAVAAPQSRLAGPGERDKKDRQIELFVESMRVSAEEGELYGFADDCKRLLTLLRSPATTNPISTEEKPCS